MQSLFVNIMFVLDPTISNLVSEAAIYKVSLQDMAADEIGKAEDEKRQKHCCCWMIERRTGDWFFLVR